MFRFCLPTPETKRATQSYTEGTVNVEGFSTHAAAAGCAMYLTNNLNYLGMILRQHTRKNLAVAAYVKIHIIY